MPGLDREMDRIIADLRAGRSLAACGETLRRLGGRAVPRLLALLDSSDARDRTVAHYGLQFCWSPAAEAAMAARLGDRDPQRRLMAAIVLERQRGRQGLADHCEALIDDPDPCVAAFALEQIEALRPDPRRLARFLPDPQRMVGAAKYLPRYYSPALTAATRALLDHPDPAVVRAAAVALIQQWDRDPQTRRRMLEALDHGCGEYRELAAEYLIWHGEAGDSRALEVALAGEGDPHVRAALTEALGTIRRRMAGPGTPPVVAGGAYGEAAALLARGDWAGARSSFMAAEDLEPPWQCRREPPPEALVRSRAARLALQSALLCIPWQGGLGVDSDSSPAPAVARRWVTPVRDFPVDAPGFGLATEAHDQVFARLVHVGQDMAWERDHGTVVAVADGQVRLAGYEASWGHLVVVEHRCGAEAPPAGGPALEAWKAAIAPETLQAGAADRVCSVYAHLGPLLAVRAGDRVQCGQRIGVIGRSFSLENGGYVAHLHFAVHLGPFTQLRRCGAAVDVMVNGRPHLGRVLSAGREVTEVEIDTGAGPQRRSRNSGWLCGYISRAFWETGAHGWLDPVAFLGGRRGDAGT